MIVSYSKKLIYCRLPKTASTSVSSALEPFSDRLATRLPVRIIRAIGLKSIHHRFFDFRSYSHFSLLGAEHILPEDFFSSALKVTVVRHPVDWAYSYYNHVLRDSFPKEYADGFRDVRRHKSFDFFLDWMTERPRRPISTQLIDENGEYLVDEIVKCERLLEEGDACFAPRGIKMKVSHMNAGNYEKPIFTAAQRDKILNLYYDDMIAFGYGEVEGEYGSPQLRANASTRMVAQELGAAGLKKYDCWDPFA
jgi:hypothetical protein